MQESIQNVFEISELLMKPIWSNEDIMKYVKCGSNSACLIHQNAAIKHDGVVKLLPKKVKRNAVLAALGIDVNQEFEKAKSIIKEVSLLLKELKGIENDNEIRNQEF